MDAVNFKGFSFSYPGNSAPVIKDASFAVPEGAFAVITGSTGSGKTTLLRCMTDALAPVGERSGSIRVFGSSCPDAFDVGLVMQDPESQIVCDTVLSEIAFGLENMGMPQDAMRRRVADAAMFFGIERLMGARTDGLSGGQKQLVNLAAAVAMRPRLLLLDEPTAQLDPISTRQLCDALRIVNAKLGITVVVATHSPEQFADLATQAFALEEGFLHAMSTSSLHFTQQGEPMYSENTWISSSAPAVAVEEAWFSYAQDSHWVLKGLDLDIPAWGITCLIGANGCGKTTLLKAIAGVLRPQRGNVSNVLGECQAYLPQDPRLLFTADAVSEEVAMIGDAREVRNGLVPEIIKGPASLSPLDLSGGLQQMLALAKLLACKPKLLLLDEPVKGLDAASELHLALLLRQEAAQGTTIIMATHDIAFASRVADCIALMFDGQIVSCAPPAEFFADSPFCIPGANAFTFAWDERQDGLWVAGER